jgi:hypothetical protein
MLALQRVEQPGRKPHYSKEHLDYRHARAGGHPEPVDRTGFPLAGYDEMTVLQSFPKRAPER